MLCKDAQKPLALLTLLARRLAGQQTLVFAASVETAHRCGVDNSDVNNMLAVVQHLHNGVAAG
jgi:hypothetical protein